MQSPLRVFPWFVLCLLGAPLAEAEPDVLRARVAVVGDGWVRVTAKQLASVGAKASALTVERHGRRVPSITDGDDLVFLALRTASPHTRRAVFLLHDGPPAPGALNSLEVTGEPGDTGKTVDRRVYAPDRLLGPLAASRRQVYGGLPPVWFAGMIQRQGKATFELGTIRGEPVGPQQVTVKLYGTHIGKVVVRALWGDADLGVAEAKTAAGGVTLSWSIPDAASATSLVLADESPKMPSPPRNDVTRTRGRIWVDAIELRGAVALPAGTGSTAFVELDISDDAGLPVDDTPRFGVVVNEHGSALGAPVHITSAGRLRVRKHGRLCLGPGRRVGKLAAPRKDAQDPVAAAGEARHVIIATPPLVAPAKRLAQHRIAQGLSSAVVNVLDIYDAFRGGEHGSVAIRQFILNLMARREQLKKPQVEYVVLAGDATYNRTDLAPLVTIPTPIARTKYNGETSADRLYVVPHDRLTGGPALGRLPFRTAKQMSTYVDRLVAYESPRADLTRNMMRFVTSEGRFGAMVDRMLESAFRRVVAEEIDPAYDIEVTFASKSSPFLWPPPEFNDKIIDSLNEGSLFFTYVGHGFAKGFDTLRVGGEYFPILNMEHLDRINVTGTPPVLFVLACTTAMFDGMEDGIGEALLKLENGPIAYWGATRICHPASNTLLGHAIAHYMTRDSKTARLGDVLSRARDYAMDPAPKESSSLRNLIGVGIGMTILGEETSTAELSQEGSYMYTLLGDPATRLAVPRGDIEVAATVDGSNVVVEARGAFPDKTKASVRVEFPRNQDPIQPKAVGNPLDPSSFPTIRENHRGMNHRVISRGEAVFEDGVLKTRLLTGGAQPGWVVKVIVVTKDQVHHGAAVLK